MRKYLQFIYPIAKVGGIYSEREVNIIIADFFDDFCTIRRDMIGEGLMDRDARGYWRVKL